jgi:hypothetical protein
MGLQNNGGNVNPFATQKKFTDPKTGQQIEAPAGFGAGLNYGNGPNPSASTMSNWMGGVGRGVQSASSMFSQSTPSAGPAPGASNPYGTESGNTYVEDRYLNRLNGTDPAFNYAASRGTADINNQMAAGGSFNSGARGQQISDFLANLTAQSQGQLDTLSGAASGARQNKLNSMFNQGLGLAGGQANTVAPYATGSAGAMNDASNRDIQLLLNKAGVDQNSRSGMLSFLMNLGKSGGSIAGGRPGG